MMNFTVHVRGVTIQCDTIDDLDAVIKRYGVNQEFADLQREGKKQREATAEATLAKFHGLGSKPTHNLLPALGELAETIVYSVIGELSGHPKLSGAWHQVPIKERAELSTTLIERIEAQLNSLPGTAHDKLSLSKAKALIKSARIDAEVEHRNDHAGICMLRNWLRKLHMDLVGGWDQDTSQDDIAKLLGEHPRGHAREFKVAP